MKSMIDEFTNSDGSIVYICSVFCKQKPTSTVEKWWILTKTLKLWKYAWGSDKYITKHLEHKTKEEAQNLIDKFIKHYEDQEKTYSRNPGTY